MVDPSIRPNKPMNAAKRRILSTALLFALAALLTGTLTIPFYFESPSMFYKFGWDKTLLRGGKLTGLTAAFLLLLQVPLAARIKWLDRLFSLPAVYTLHKYNARIILCLVFVHPIAVFAPDGILMIPLEARYWPEWAGAALFLVILCQYGFSQWRRRVFRTYEKWLFLHRALGLFTLVMLVVHMLYVSETFEHDGLPRTLALASAFVIFGLWCWIRFQPVRVRKTVFTVDHIAPSGKDAFTIGLVPSNQPEFQYFPGQFAFLSFDADEISREPHPFTLSSSPTRPENIAFTIRVCGDWTRRIHTLKPGQTAHLQGPFGAFSHLNVTDSRDLIMIAGGIGITPMLSMLRYMHDTHDPRRTLLLWSNKTPEYGFNFNELRSMEKELTGFSWIPIFTREKGDEGHHGRLNRRTLETLLRAFDRDAAIFLCGPPPMIEQVRLDLKGLGFSKKSIRFEAFGL